MSEQETPSGVPQSTEFRGKKPSKIPYIIMAVAILAVVYVVFGGKGGNITGGAINNEIVENNELVKIPIEGITKKASFYEYEGIKYFAVKSGDSVKIALDACDVCHNSKKGYRQEGGDMICNNCGNHYPISGLGTKNLRGGGCWPGYLPSKVEGDYLVIKKSDLEKNRYMFN